MKVEISQSLITYLFIISIVHVSVLVMFESLLLFVLRLIPPLLEISGLEEIGAMDSSLERIQRSHK